jgi:hypothetical protein
MNEILTCTTERWQPVIGDPSWRGWATVLIYLAVMGLAVLVARRAPFPGRSRRRERLFWILVAVLMGLLAINKQLDLQSLLTSVARCLAMNQGWYEDRRIVQVRFVWAVFAVGILGIVALGLYLRNTFARTGLAVLGLGLVCVFVAIRAASFHHVDNLIDGHVFGLRVNWLLEMPGPLIVLLASVRAGRSRVT